MKRGRDFLFRSVKRFATFAILPLASYTAQIAHRCNLINSAFV